ncbi:hypothetical protein [uncultured Winogradskyella sp.]|uniref:hypothetical protein n=1 Tax=uncultured Winogradskyella sp. TaxID=395353 RepID=UPI002634FD97|nr:hypothetical protein [uncultured Winogradskyella sp.]
MTLKHIYISVIAVVIIALTTLQNDKSKETYSLKTEVAPVFAGDVIILEFSSNSNNMVQLYCSNSYGSVLLSPDIENKVLKFHIPESIAKKSGVLNWQLITATNPLEGKIIVKPKPSIKTIESYLGPPSIEAGGTDYTMLVVIPTDDLDNPLADSTKVQVKHQFLDNQANDLIFTKNGFAYKNIYSYQPSGRILISSESLGLSSKEYDVNVMPAIPTDFSIEAQRIHDYADSNQITTFETSILKDRFNNVISDGTFVNFYITDKNGNKTVTSGASINGIAKSKILHPDHEDQWTVKAYIEGMANSDSITLDYKQAVSDFEVAFSEGNRIINVGPLQSFMNQKIPDGLVVKLKVYTNDNIIDELSQESYNGYVKFKLNEDRFSATKYNFVIETAGITKSYNNITYE